MSEEKLNNKVEKLRALIGAMDEFPSDRFETNPLTGDDSVSQTDITLMYKFKRIFQTDSKKIDSVITDFLTLMDSSDVDAYTALYYKRQLLNGPFRIRIQDAITAGKVKSWKEAPDILGTNGDLNISQSSVPIVFSSANLIATNASLVTLNKIPLFMQNNIADLTLNLQFIANLTVSSSLIVDDSPHNISDRSDAFLNKQAHGLIIIRDASRQQATEQASASIKNSALGTLNNNGKAIYNFQKEYNPYIDNISTVTNTGVRRKLQYEVVIIDPETGKEKTEIKSTYIVTDLYGNTYDSDDAKDYIMQVKNDDDQNVELDLYSVRGRLGDTVEPKEEEQEEYKP